MYYKRLTQLELLDFHYYHKRTDQQDNLPLEPRKELVMDKTIEAIVDHL